MSDGYADRLRKGVEYGVCGLPEIHDTTRKLDSCLDKLVKCWRGAGRVVVHTGAGISTAAGIRDFRGPRGVWTEEKKNKREVTKQQRQAKKQKLSTGPSASENNSQTSHPAQPTGVARTTTTTTTADSSRDVPFADAVPTYTHMALKALYDAGRIHYLVTQNVDGLHGRTGFPRSHMAELHGNIFAEICADCIAWYVHDVDLGGVGLRPTGRHCTRTRVKDETIRAPSTKAEDREPVLDAASTAVTTATSTAAVDGDDDGMNSGISAMHGDSPTTAVSGVPLSPLSPTVTATSSLCHGRLCDFVLDWDDALPLDKLQRAEEECLQADLSLCLGTSLRISPANELPILTRSENGGDVCIVNLQATGKDDEASIRIRADVEAVMQYVLNAFNLSISPYDVTTTIYTECTVSQVCSHPICPSSSSRSKCDDTSQRLACDACRHSWSVRCTSVPGCMLPCARVKGLRAWYRLAGQSQWREILEIHSGGGGYSFTVGMARRSIDQGCTVTLRVQYTLTTPVLLSPRARVRPSSPNPVEQEYIIPRFHPNDMDSYKHVFKAVFPVARITYPGIVTTE